MRAGRRERLAGEFAGRDRLLRLLVALVRLLAGQPSAFDILLLPDGEPDCHSVVLRDRRRAAVDDELRQEWVLAASQPVSLAQHQLAVAGRALQLAQAVGLPDTIAASLHAAGLHHDDGKADPRFQIVLGGDHLDEPLAKSAPGTTLHERRRRRSRAGLPAGWRHEQRSVAEAWPVIRAMPGINPDLALRLVGTSHGRGRIGFPHSSDELLLPRDDDNTRQTAAELFDTGLWDELIERTDRRIGVFLCGYLEAVHRAADGQVSQEGS